MVETKSTNEQKGLVWCNYPGEEPGDLRPQICITRKGYEISICVEKARNDDQCIAFFWAKIPTTDNPLDHYNVIHKLRNGKFMEFRIDGRVTDDIPKELPGIKEEITISITKASGVLYKDGIVYYLKRYYEFYPCAEKVKPPDDAWVYARIEEFHRILIDGGFIVDGNLIVTIENNHRGDVL